MIAQGLKTTSEASQTVILPARRSFSAGGSEVERSGKQAEIPQQNIYDISIHRNRTRE